MAFGRLRNRPANCLTGLLVVAALVAAGCSGSTAGKAESVEAVAGGAGGAGFFDGSSADPVRFDSPSAVAVITTGDRFVADTNNHVIRKVDSSGTVTTFAGTFGLAGSADGEEAAARFNLPSGIVAVGNILFVCDTGNHTVRRISATGIVTTVAGTPGVAGATDNTAGPGNVRFSSPRGIASDGGSTLYVADTGNHAIRRVFLSGATATYAGSGLPGFDDGTGTAATFDSPEGVAYSGGDVYVADTGNHAIRKITPAGSVGNVITLAGDGTAGFVDNAFGLAARFSSPRSVIVVGSTLFVADTGNHVIRKIDTTNANFVSTLAGTAQVPGFSDGVGTGARFDEPRGLSVQESVPDLIYVADTKNDVIRQVTTSASVVTIAGNPPQAGLVNAVAGNARFDAPAGIVAIADNLVVSDRGNNTLRKIDSSGTVTSLTGAVFDAPQGIVAVGSDLYVADSGNHAIRKVTSSGTVTTFAGSDTGEQGFVDETGTAARFSSPRGIATDGTFLYVADTGNHAIRKIDLAGAAVTTLAGDGVAGLPSDTPYRFHSPEGVAVMGSDLYVADTGNHAVERVTAAGIVTTYAGSTAAEAGFVDDVTGTAARFDTPRGIAAIESALYVADTGNHAIRRISSLRKVTTFAGDPAAATTKNGDPSSALMNAPVGIAGVSGTLYFTDVNENVVRRIRF